MMDQEYQVSGNSDFKKRLFLNSPFIARPHESHQPSKPVKPVILTMLQTLLQILKCDFNE